MTSFLIRADRAGDHVHLRIYAGETPGSRGFAGTLTLRTGEFDRLRQIIEMGGKALPGADGCVEIEMRP